jgi:quinol monooxygenase YgiN
MHATLREYEGIQDPVEALQPLREGLLAEMQALPGFIAYYFVDVGEAGDRMISLSVFESQEAAEESNRIAALWVERWIAEHPTTAPTASRVDAGPVVSYASAS